MPPNCATCEESVRSYSALLKTALSFFAAPLLNSQSDNTNTFGAVVLAAAKLTKISTVSILNMSLKMKQFAEQEWLVSSDFRGVSSKRKKRVMTLFRQGFPVKTPIYKSIIYTVTKVISIIYTLSYTRTKNKRACVCLHVFPVYRLGMYWESDDTMTPYANACLHRDF